MNNKNNKRLSFFSFVNLSGADLLPVTSIALHRSLLLTRIVLSAAHCVKRSLFQLLLPVSLSIILRLNPVRHLRAAQMEKG